MRSGRGGRWRVGRIEGGWSWRDGRIEGGQGVLVALRVW